MLDLEKKTWNMHAGFGKKTSVTWQTCMKQKDIATSGSANAWGLKKTEDYSTAPFQETIQRSRHQP